MIQTDDGGPAFPVDTANQYPHQVGMSLRDYFAGQVAVGLVTFENGERLDKLFHGDEDPSPAMYFARIAYRVADALLKTRSAQGVSPQEPPT